MRVQFLLTRLGVGLAGLYVVFMMIVMRQSSMKNSELALENKKLADLVDQTINKFNKKDIEVESQVQKPANVVEKFNKIKSNSEFVEEKLNQGELNLNKELKNGPGEMGRPVLIDETKLNKEEKARYDEGWKQHQFNQYAADMISVNRSLPDFRFKECKQVKWFHPLPTVSVVIIFYNEALSVLRRTVHSVINRSDPKLLVEIILVDDASTLGM
jgi:hypothetical protein